MVYREQKEQQQTVENSVRFRAWIQQKKKSGKKIKLYRDIVFIPSVTKTTPNKHCYASGPLSLPLVSWSLSESDDIIEAR
jgi:hypothetical protein